MSEIFESVKNILEYQLDFDIYALDFDETYYENLIDELKNSYSAQEIEKNKKEIQKAIKSYFYSLFQNITISHNGKFQINKEFKKDYDEEQDRILHALRINLALIFNQPELYKPFPYMWIIPQDERSRLINDASKISNDNFKDLLREEINYVFELKLKDIILFYKKEVYIRIYTPPKVRTTTEERRFNGINVSELEELYRELFPENIEKQLQEIMDSLLDEKLNFSIIDHHLFSNTFLQVFRSCVDMVMLHNEIEIDAYLAEPLNGYILRRYFHSLLLYVAQNLLDYVERRDLNAERFLKYFIDKGVLGESNRSNSEIVDDKGQRWGFSSILSAIVQNKQTTQRVNVEKYKIRDLQDKIKEKRDKILDEEREYSDVSKLIKAIDHDLMIKNSELSALETTKKKLFNLGDAKDKKEELEKELTLLKDKRRYLTTSQITVGKNIKNREIDLKNWVKKLKDEENSLTLLMEQNSEISERYDLLLNAIAKAIAKR